MDDARYIKLLTALIGEVEGLQVYRSMQPCNSLRFIAAPNLPIPRRLCGLRLGLHPSLPPPPPLQNAPPDFNPTEDKASDHVLKALEPYTVENGGPLIVERISFVKGRGNIIIKYPGKGDATHTIGFVGWCVPPCLPASRSLQGVPPLPTNPLKCLSLLSILPAILTWCQPTLRAGSVTHSRFRSRATSCMGVAPLTALAMSPL